MLLAFWLLSKKILTRNPGSFLSRLPLIWLCIAVEMACDWWIFTSPSPDLAEEMMLNTERPRRVESNAAA